MTDDDMDFTRPLPKPGEAHMDFTRPAGEVPSAPFKAAQSRFYDAKITERIFRDDGREERFAAGAILFEEDQKVASSGIFSKKIVSRMYYIAQGEVELRIAGRLLDTLKPGEVFGEMAVITGQPRSATATARTEVIARSLDQPQLQGALGHSPEFALMLASVMYDRLRFLAARLAAKPRAAGVAAREATVFEPALVTQLVASLPRTAIVRWRQQEIIFKEGQAGTFMYLVKSGRVAIAVGGNVVEVVGPGGTFGEMAVVDQSPRTARAGTLEETELLSIDKATLMELVKKQPAFAMALLRGIADRLRFMNSQLVGSA
jgi:CRP/FNR family cyclic AMP-dependent transcriptional regulator